VRCIPVEVALGKDEGLSKACVANLDTIATVPRRALAARIGELAPAKVRELDDALCFALGVER